MRKKKKEKKEIISFSSVYFFVSLCPLIILLFEIRIWLCCRRSCKYGKIDEAVNFQDKVFIPDNIIRIWSSSFNVMWHEIALWDWAFFFQFSGINYLCWKYTCFFFFFLLTQQCWWLIFFCLLLISRHICYTVSLSLQEIRD